MVRCSFSNMQAPLLAYNHFVEAVFVLNECRPGLQASASDNDPISLTQMTAGQVAEGACRLTGSEEATRAKRDTIYRSAPNQTQSHCSALCTILRR